MAEYIEREAYRKRLADLEGWCQDLRKPGLKQALEMFDEIPAAEVAPVVHCFTCRLPDCRCAGSCASRYNRLPSEKVRSDAARKAYRKKMQKEGKRDG